MASKPLTRSEPSVTSVARWRRRSVVAEAAADETFKMLLLCNMELYRTSSKTGEMKAVKMSSP